MQFQQPNLGFGGMWLAPAFFGALLVLLGVLILLFPRLLALIVAGALITIGASLLAIAWAMRGRVVYRRFDDEDEL